MSTRFLDPRERAIHRANQSYNRANDERREALVSTGRVPLSLNESVAASEKQMAAAHKVGRSARCFKCSAKIDLAKDGHYRMTVTCLVRFRPDEPQPYMQYLSPQLAGKFEQGAAGVVVMVEPGTNAELALCLDCAEHATDYLNEQLVDPEDGYALHLQGITESGELGNDLRKSPKKARRTSTSRKRKTRAREAR